jgi:hypothetical protein
MTIPASLVAHVKHVYQSSPQRDVLLRIAEAVEKLNERCACVNTVQLDALEVPTVVVSKVEVLDDDE